MCHVYAIHMQSLSYKVKRKHVSIGKVMSGVHLSLPVAFVALVGYIAAVCHHLH